MEVITRFYLNTFPISGIDRVYCVNERSDALIPRKKEELLLRERQELELREKGELAIKETSSIEVRKKHPLDRRDRLSKSKIRKNIKKTGEEKREN